MSKKAISKKYIDRLRNIGVIAHIDAGKTTLTERSLFYSHRSHRMGEVHEGAATMDFLPEEQERGITISSACTSCQWGDYAINIIDTPGHVDFTIEVERSLRVLDGAIGVFCGVGGVEPQSETVWRQSEKFHVPKLAFVNKMDRPGADFERVLRELRERLGAKAAAVQIPLGQGQEFKAVIDLVELGKLVFDAASQGEHYERLPLSAQELELAAPWREERRSPPTDVQPGRRGHPCGAHPGLFATRDHLARPRSRFLRLRAEEHRGATPARWRVRVSAQPHRSSARPGA